MAYDQQTLIGIYEEFSPRLFRYSARMLGDADLAEECVADVFSRFLQLIQSDHSKIDNVKPYLYRMAHNWVTDHYRRQPPPLLPLDAEVYPDYHNNPVQVLTTQQEQEQVRLALLLLTPEQRQVVELRFLEEWGHSEIAAVLGKTVEATRALQYRAMNLLRDLLLKAEEDSNA